LRNPADIRAFLNLSLAQISQFITDPTSHNQNIISRKTWWAWENETRTPHIDQVRQIEQVIASALHRELAYDSMLDESPRKFIIRIAVGARRWTVRAYVACARCGRMYNLRRIASRRCMRCVNKANVRAKGKK